jgi:hypothetical protein
VPSGAGFQVTFCPAGVSTDIIATVSGKATSKRKMKSEGASVLKEVPWVDVVVVPLCVVAVMMVLM